MAQAPVYSVNAVGYVTKVLTNKYNLISNPLNGTNNSINTTIPVVPEDSYILRWDPSANGGAGSFGDPSFYIGGSWSPDVTINPGEGFFLYCEAPGLTSITFVGEVPQGNLTNYTSTATLGYSLLSHIVPQSIALDAAGVNFPAQEDDFVLFWLPNEQTYSDPIFYIGGAWTSPVVPAVGEGFFVHNEPGNGGNAWIRTFSVN